MNDIQHFCSCHCGGPMFWRHLHAESCPLSTHGDEYPGDAGVSKAVPRETRATEIDSPSETVESVTSWANETFGKATILAQVERARKEFDELEALMQTHCGGDHLAEEAADVVICLYRVIGTLDPEAINKKMAKNRARKWKVDGQGCAQHVGE